jgi:hypothetical protein
MNFTVQDAEEARAVLAHFEELTGVRASDGGIVMQIRDAAGVWRGITAEALATWSFWPTELHLDSVDEV